MKPPAPLNQNADPRQPLRKLSNPQIGHSTDRPSSTPVSFFLTRGQDFEIENDQHSPPRKRSPSVKTLQEAIDEVTQPLSRKVSPSVEHDGVDPRRRRSTIKASSPQVSRRGSSIHSNTPSLPREESALLPSLEPSLPSSPETRSSRSLQQSRAPSSAGDNSSQAIASSEDDDPEVASSAVQDSAPQLIMPSIKMPSRRPFTQRGKRLGRCKIMVAGAKGSGKTSLIKSIVQVCEDIVHVDPLTASNSSITTAGAKQSAVEIHASTKPYPAWWSDVDESKILRRRKSMGDAVLERNVCFVEIRTSDKGSSVIRYLEQQLQRAIVAPSNSSNDFISMLSGRGAAQVDVVLYLVSQETFQQDCECIHQLSEVANVVPVLSKTDLLSPEEIQSLKNRCQQLPTALPKLPLFPSAEQSQVDASSLPPDSTTSSITTSPYTTSCIPGSDKETMDASLLMSPEYVQPLHNSELTAVVSELFDPTVLSFLRHTAAKKLVNWQTFHPRLSTTRSSSPASQALPAADSPGLSSMTNSGLLIPGTSPSLSSLDPSTSYALARVADHTQREERFAQIRLSKWAEELQMSLARERERYEKIARGERAIWLVECMGEEVAAGRVNTKALVKNGEWARERLLPNQHDPLGILNLQETLRTKGWLAFQVVGSMGVVGGLVVWFVRNVNWNAWTEWVESWRA